MILCLLGVSMCVVYLMLVYVCIVFNVNMCVVYLMLVYVYLLCLGVLCCPCHFIYVFLYFIHQFRLDQCHFPSFTMTKDKIFLEVSHKMKKYIFHTVYMLCKIFQDLFRIIKVKQL